MSPHVPSCGPEIPAALVVRGRPRPPHRPAPKRNAARFWGAPTIRASGSPNLARRDLAGSTLTFPGARYGARWRCREHASDLYPVAGVFIRGCHRAHRIPLRGESSMEKMERHGMPTKARNDARSVQCTSGKGKRPKTTEVRACTSTSTGRAGSSHSSSSTRATTSRARCSRGFPRRRRP